MCLSHREKPRNQLFSLIIDPDRKAQGPRQVMGRINTDTEQRDRNVGITRIPTFPVSGFLSPFGGHSLRSCPRSLEELE